MVDPNNKLLKHKNTFVENFQISCTSPNDVEEVKGHLDGAKAQENCWLEHATKLLNREKLDEADAIAWSAYHASLQTPSEELLPAITQLLPLFHEKAATAAMIKHGMDMNR